MQYRPDIDGLRALAIVPVLLYHLDVDSVAGGFVGVDVFFVISGFLITSIIAKNLDTGNFTFADFYRRRALRILPPLFFLLAVTMVASYLLLLPFEAHEIGKTAISATVFYSNIDLWRSADYFNPISDTNPLLHTWSLGIEEQFYILVPFLLVALHLKFWKRRVGVFALCVAGSFLLSVIVIAREPTGTFYLLPTRFWEMAVGSVLALLGVRAQVTGRAAEVLSTLGVLGIAGAIFLLDGGSVFPGYNALAPVLGTAALLASGQTSWVGRLLSARLPVAIGKISYSLYLWHWPLIVFYKLETGPELRLAEIGGLIAASFACAIVSFALVETPFRRISYAVSTPRVLMGAAGSMATVVVGALFLQWAAEERRDLPNEVVAMSDFNDYEETERYREQFRTDECFLTSRTVGAFSAFNADFCLAEDNQTLLLGDSHGAHLAGPLEKALRESDNEIVSVGQATASGCKPLRNATGEARCTDLMSFIYEDWLPSSAPPRVILAGRWQEADIEPLRTSIDYLKIHGVREVVVLGPTVEYFGSVPSLLARDVLAGTDSLEAFQDKARSELDGEMLRRLETDEIQYVSVHQLVCPAEGCLLTVEDTPFQFDYGHFTDAGAHVVAAGIAAQIEK